MQPSWPNTNHRSNWHRWWRETTINVKNLKQWLAKWEISRVCSQRIACWAVGLHSFINLCPLNGNRRNRFCRNGFVGNQIFSIDSSQSRTSATKNHRERKLVNSHQIVVFLTHASLTISIFIICCHEIDAKIKTCLKLVLDGCPPLLSCLQSSSLLSSMQLPCK